MAKNKRIFVTGIVIVAIGVFFFFYSYPETVPLNYLVYFRILSIFIGFAGLITIGASIGNVIRKFFGMKEPIHIYH